jgi:hypothetical protein
MRTLAGEESQLHFTRLSSSSISYISNIFQTMDGGLGRAKASCHTAGVMDLIKEQPPEEGVCVENICLLDPKAEKALTTEDGDGRFKWFLFGVSPRSPSTSHFKGSCL